MASLIKLNKNTYFNEYQFLPENTYGCECYYLYDNTDIWTYYLVEVTNPDYSITTPFLNIRSNPFITTVTNDNCHIMLKKINNDTISIEIYGNNYFYGNPKDLTKEQLKYLKSLLSKYFNKSLQKYFSFNQNKIITILD